MEKFFGTLITILLIFYVLKLIGRLVFPWLLKRFATRMQKKANEQFSSMFGDQFNGNFYGQAQNQQEYQNSEDNGEPQITISRTQKEKPSSYSELDGQYVDYEEIK